MFAKVVIDIKHEEVNQLYDYIVPSKFEGFLTRGMRVIVPFGNMERLAFVVETHEKSNAATKEIKEVLDSTPIIDDELFLMLDVMSKGSPELISALYQTAIPQELLVSYQKVCRIKNYEQMPKDLLPFFNSKGTWRLKVSDQVYYPRLKRLKDLNVISIETLIKEKKTENKIKMYTYNKDHRYTKIGLYPMIDDIKDDEKSFFKKELLDLGFTESMIKTLSKHHVFLEEEHDVRREIQHHFELVNEVIHLSDEQKDAVYMINQAHENEVFLLKGITGSGKTEVYLKVIEHILKNQGRVLILVPEIQMVPQMAKRLKSLFDHVAIYHSGLSKGERYDEYRTIISGQANIILGTRSSVFIPIQDLKLIIMDEEHDDSYIQNEGVYYDSKELILERARIKNIPVVLGSATPSITSMYHADKKDYTLLELTKRPFNLALPKLTFVDMKEELKSKHYSIFSRLLIQAIKERIVKKEQTILLINRKGYAPFVMCRACGDVPKCSHCDVSLVFYKDKKILKCPYCGYEEPFEATCHFCHEPKIKEVGIGIEYVIEQLKKLMPQAKILRMDQSVMKTKHAHEVIWNDFRNEEADILIGTQMVSKGLDFPKVTLVGVLIADMLHKIPSYRSSEKAFMLLTQVTGRSGRHLQGEAIIQGYDLNHVSIKSLNGGYDDFYKEALYQRKLLGYQPFNQTSQLLFSGMSFLKTYQKAFMFKKALIPYGFDVLGPSQALIKKIKDHYRFTLTLKYKDRDLSNLFELIEEMKTKEVSISFHPTLDTW